MKSVLQDWVMELPLREQGTLADLYQRLRSRSEIPVE